MTSRPLTVTVPETLLKQIRARARQAKRSVEAEVVHLLADAVTGDDRLHPEIEAAMADIEMLDDESLQRAIKPILSATQSKRLAELNYKAQDEGLTATEKREQRRLMHIADKSMVVRAAVLAELHKRGVDVSEYVSP